jgi:hypothetical protein
MGGDWQKRGEWQKQVVVDVLTGGIWPKTDGG